MRSASLPGRGAKLARPAPSLAAAADAAAAIALYSADIAAPTSDSRAPAAGSYRVCSAVIRGSAACGQAGRAAWQPSRPHVGHRDSGVGTGAKLPHSSLISPLKLTRGMGRLGIRDRD